MSEDEETHIRKGCRTQMKTNTIAPQERAGVTPCFRCPDCKRDLKEIRYEDHGYVSFPNITDEHSRGEGWEFPQRKYFCPECGQEIEHEDLVKAGAIE